MRSLRALVFSGLFLLGCGPKASDKPPEIPSGGPAAAPEGLPPLFAPLFREGATASYLWDFVVDTHDEEGSQASRRATLDCTTKSVRQVGAGWVSEILCEEREGGGDVNVAPALSVVCAATRQGLWIEDSALKSPQEIEALLTGDPWMSYPPKEDIRSWSAEEDGMTVEHTISVGTSDRGTTWCRTDASTFMYGDSRSYCVHPDKGLVFVELVGREGPSIESYTLIDW
jgi:hypothetical protein